MSRLSSTKQAEEQIENIREELTKSKNNADDDLKVFTSIFSDISSAILGSEVSAGVSIIVKGLKLSAERNVKLVGTALVTIRTITFYIATIIQSIEGEGNRPRFLIDDSPSEGGFARIVYARLFLLARHVEEAFECKPVSFQYILATTTAPPEDIQVVRGWLTGDPMSAQDKKSKLLKEAY